jgi:hypothetical protein
MALSGLDLGFKFGLPLCQVDNVGFERAFEENLSLPVVHCLVRSCQKKHFLVGCPDVKQNPDSMLQGTPSFHCSSQTEFVATFVDRASRQSLLSHIFEERRVHEPHTFHKTIQNYCRI